MTNVIEIGDRLIRKADAKLKRAIETIREMPKERASYLEAFWLIVLTDLQKSVEGEVEPGPLSEELFEIMSGIHGGCYFSPDIDGNETPFSRDTEVCTLCAVKIKNVLNYVNEGGDKRANRASGGTLH